MLSKYPTDPKELRRYNLKKYKGVPPPWELIEEVIRKSGIKRLAVFEYAWMMPRSTLTWYKTGTFGLAPKYWHIFYDFDNVSEDTNMKTIKRKKHSNMAYKSTYILSENKNILDDVQSG